MFISRLMVNIVLATMFITTASADEWFSYDTNAKKCLDEGTQQQGIAEYRDHGVNDVTSR
jgi:hypothetical protein